MKLRTLLFCLLFLCVLPAICQQTPSALLWRIQGKGQQSPSYLYGTMHLTDSRLFNFGDSLYNAIEKTNGFAMEINPDDMMPYLIDLIKDEIKNSRHIKEILSEKEYKKYSSALAKKLKKPADEITMRDIFREKNRQVEESYKKGGMLTAMDLYLYDIARRLGKWVGGVEDMSDQAGLTDLLVDESDVRQIAVGEMAGEKAGLERMIGVYLNNDLNAIAEISNNQDSLSRDALLVKRNIKMARRMDSLMALRTMVFAVGAAHLPGTEGVITLLRKRGFRVEPVYFSKRIKAADYKVKELDLPWVNVKDSSGLYTVEMPGAPGDLQMYDVLRMKMFYNVFNGTAYMTTASPTHYRPGDEEELMNSVGSKIFDAASMKKGKPVTVNGIGGKEFEKNDDEGYRLGFILYKNNTFYLAVAYAQKKDQRTESDLKRFLASYNPVERTPIAEGAALPYTYTDTINAFKVDMPGKPSPFKDVSVDKDKTIRSNIVSYADLENDQFFIAGAITTTRGFSILNDSNTVESIRKNSAGRFSRIITDTMLMQEGRRMFLNEGKIINSKYFQRTQYFFRGNKWYSLVAIYDSARPNTAIDRFFASFRMLNFNTTAWQKQHATDSLFSVTVPGKLTYETDTSQFSYPRYIAYDSIKGNSYEIQVSDFGKYYWYTSDTAFWPALAKTVLTYNDTLVSEHEIDNYGIHGVDLIKGNKNSLNKGRVRKLVYGDTLYTLYTSQAETALAGEEPDLFFESFRFLKPAPPTTIFTSKAKLLLNDLLSADSATRANAKEAFETAPFVKAELPLLQDALLKKYPEDSTDYAERTRRQIAAKIIDLDDSASVAFAKTNYAAADPALKMYLLEIISAEKTSANYAAMQELMLHSAPAKELSWKFTGYVQDSAQLAARLFPAVLPLLKDTGMGPGLVHILLPLIDSGLVQLSVVNPYQQDILNLADWRINASKADSLSFVSGDYELVAILGKFKNAASRASLQKWLSVAKDYIQLGIVEALTANNQPVNNKYLVKLAADKNYRVELYTTLQKNRKQHLFPRQYLTQQQFAQCVAWTAYDDYEPLTISLLKEKITSFNGKKCRFFFYKLHFNADDEVADQLVCVGPYALDITNMSVKEAYSIYDYDETYDAKTVNQRMNVLIKKMETDAVDNDE